MEEKEDKKENINTKINFYSEQIDIKLNSDYNSFVNNVCKIINISLDQYKSLELSYKDEDDDNIILSTDEDYELFFDQLKDKRVNGIIIEIKEDSDINPIECFDSALDYKEQIDEVNKQIINENNNLNKNIDNNINNNINDNIINKKDNIQDNFVNKNSNLILNGQPNKDIPIDDLIFYRFGCSYCKSFPIICLLYYCSQCHLYLCENCFKNYGNHIHPFIKFESNQELMKFKEKEKMEQMNNSKNNNFANIYNSNNNNFDNNNRNFEQFNYVNPFILINNNRFKDIMRQRRKMWPGFYLYIKSWEYKRLFDKVRKAYNLEGINDHQLMDALFKNNGNIYNAVVLLTTKY